MSTGKPTLATIWLDGCSGCHMSFLDMDERLLELAARVDLVYGCLVDAKEFPEGVDITLVEGAVSSEDDLRKIRQVRQRTRILVSLGDCAVTSNVPGMRNPFGPGQRSTGPTWRTPRCTSRCRKRRCPPSWLNHSRCMRGYPWTCSSLVARRRLTASSR